MEPQAKQQITDRIKQANNILVTVSNDPSVDQLAACIGVTLLLNKMNKHATAVFSGAIPSTVEFLQPEKTIEKDTHSLRDFIISLDKNKADKLRYKVEDKFVRIYITPYKTSISEKDLVFSEGDFNVEVVLALGVRDKTQLDAAITQHGRILHDATVISVNHGQDKAPQLGQINWQDPAASSLCEMLVSISESFGTGLIDNQMATAFLTGIVAETERFSNPKTSPKVMTMAAQLMAAGANQQLIVSKLEPPTLPPEPSMPVKPKTPTPSIPPATPAPPTDTLNIPHDEEETPQPEPEVPPSPDEIKIDERGNIVDKPALPTPLAAASEPSAPEISKVQSALPTLSSPQPAEPAVLPPTPVAELPGIKKMAEPLPEAHELLDPTNKPHLSSPFTATMGPEWYERDEVESFDPLNQAPKSDDKLLGHTSSKAVAEPAVPSVGLSSATTVFPEPDNSVPTLPTPTVDSARGAVQTAIAAEPYNPEFPEKISALNAQPLPGDLAQPAPPPVPPPLPQSATAAANLVSTGKGQPAELAKPL